MPHLFANHRRIFSIVVALVFGSVCPSEDDLARGKMIFQKSCASCHGGQGQGVDEHYADALIGDSSVGELAKVIAETMPEESPESCVGKDARDVAAYIHEMFYSPAAQLRNRPPRTQLSRLTAPELQQSLADLYERFQEESYVLDDRGIDAVYVDDKNLNRKKIKIERVDDLLDFDFGNKGPGAGIDRKEFYIHWAGSLKVDHTGRYDIILRSSCSCMMYFGHRDRELFNNHVQSEGKEEFRATMNLIGGRLYPLKITFTQRKRKTKQPPAKISLSWVPPNGTEQIIPNRHLLPKWMPGTFALQEKLPPDDRSYGYERGTAVDRGWDQSTTNAALEFAQFATRELYPRYRQRHKKDKDDNRQVLRGFLTEILEVAFRGSLNEPMRELYIDRQIDKSPDDAEAIRRCLLLALKSPRFLYPALDSDRSPSQRAGNRLARVLFDSLPSDQPLLNLIRNKKLTKDAQIAAAAWRMTADYRCQAKMRAMIYHWLDLDDLDELTKDSKRFPGFDRQLVGDLRASLDALIDDVVMNEQSDFRELLLANWTFTNDRLNEFFGQHWSPTGPESNELRRSVTDQVTRAGLLTHPLVLGKLSYHTESSPIHRGVFLVRQMLGRTLRPPNEAFTSIDPDLHPGLTTRQRVELQTNEKNCQVCHGKINALGFSLENFDAAGRFRTLDNGKPVDASGHYLAKNGRMIQFKGPRGLAEFLVSSSDCHEAFVETVFEFFVKQPIAAFGVDRRKTLTKQFREDDFNIRKLITRVAVIAATEN